MSVKIVEKWRLHTWLVICHAVTINMSKSGCFKCHQASNLWLRVKIDVGFYTLNAANIFLLFAEFFWIKLTSIILLSNVRIRVLELVTQTSLHCLIYLPASVKFDCHLSFNIDNRVRLFIHDTIVSSICSIFFASYERWLGVINSVFAYEWLGYLFYALWAYWIACMGINNLIAPPQLPIWPKLMEGGYVTNCIINLH